MPENETKLYFSNFLSSISFSDLFNILGHNLKYFELASNQIKDLGSGGKVLILLILTIFMTLSIQTMKKKLLPSRLGL